MRKKLKVCLAASAGGHLVQLLRLAASWEKQETVFISTLPAVEKQLSRMGRTYIVGDCNRQHPLRTLAVSGRVFFAILRERPDIVISTGAAPGFLSCFFGKLLGARVIWIDSIANTQRLSLSGRMIRPFCTICLTQWKHLRDQRRNIDFAGAVI
jgi:UDP-N-acetylglucosamine:LPS N-acetylglucosamine transferase